MSNKKNATIIGLGSFLPKKILTNFDLEQLVDTSNEWIVTRTGIKERRIANNDESPVEMGVIAAKRAMEDANITLSEIDLILVATMTPNHLCPSTACLIQEALGGGSTPAFDVQAACSGYLYGLSLAKAYIESGMYNNILFIASEKMSSVMDFTDRTTCILFGDGANAAVISNKQSGLQITDIHLGADGSLGETIIIEAGGAKKPATEETVKNREHFIKMKGREVFKHAVRYMSSSALHCLKRSGLSKDDVDWIVAHQANARILDAIARKLEIPSHKFQVTIDKYGNTSASSIGIALDELCQEKKILPGSQLLLLAAGSGFTWASALLKKVE